MSAGATSPAGSSPGTIAIRRETPDAVRRFGTRRPGQPAVDGGCARVVGFVFALYIAAAIGSPLLGGLVLATPFVFSARKLAGRTWLRRALEKESNASLLAVSGQVWPERVVQREALGALALRALERGDVDDMVRQARQAAQIEVDAVPGIGSVMPALVAWLLPGRMPPSSVWPSRVYTIDVARENPLLPALRLLESTASDDDAAVVGAWQAVSSSEALRGRPRLYVLLQSVAAERIPAVAAELGKILDAKHGERTREYLARFFPRFDEPRAAGYRIDADPERALTLATSSDHTRAIVATGRDRHRRRMGIARRMRQIGWTTTALGVGALFIAPAFGLGLFLTTLAIGGARRFANPRLASVARAFDIPDAWASTTWRREFDTNAAGRAVVRNAREREAFVSAVLAEQALEAGDAAAAWNHVQWWLAGFDPEYTDGATLRPIAGVIARVAALAGHLALAERLLDRVVPTLPVQARTLQGDGADAVALARAVVAARRGDWELCAEHLSKGRLAERRWFSTEITRFQRGLFRAMAARAREQGETVRGWRRPPRPRSIVESVRRLWPELVD